MSESTKHCFKCNAHRPIVDGKTVKDAKGYSRWICAECRQLTGKRGFPNGEISSNRPYKNIGFECNGLLGHRKPKTHDAFSITTGWQGRLRSMWRCVFNR